MDDTSEQLASMTLADSLEAAISHFGTIQLRSNREWLQIAHPESEPATGEERVQPPPGRMSRAQAMAALAKQRSTPSHINNVMSTSLGGMLTYWATRPPTSESQRTTFLAHLAEAVNRPFDHDSPKYKPLPLPKDYYTLLGVTDGLRDIDLRHSGVCGIDGIRESDIDKMTSDEVECLPHGHSLWRLGWELSVGFVLGRGTPAHDNWLVYYYCARQELTQKGPRTQGRDQEIQADEKKWKWRLFYKEPERFQHSFFDPMVFDGILEWLGFYQDWFVRETEIYPDWYIQCVEDVKIVYRTDLDIKEDLSEDEFDWADDGLNTDLLG